MELKESNPLQRVNSSCSSPIVIGKLPEPHLFPVRGALMKSFMAFVQWDADSQLYVGLVPGIPGAHSQGATLDELQLNLQEVVELCLEEVPQDELPHFVGIQQINVNV